MTREEFFAEVLSLDLGNGWRKRIELGKVEISREPRLGRPQLKSEILERELKLHKVQYDIDLEDVEKIQIALTKDKLKVICEVLI